MKISIYGVGYVGLITGVCFAKLGHTVICYDIDSKKVNKLKKGKVEIFEQNLENFLQETLKSKQIQFTDQLEEACKHGTIHMICVGTPSRNDGAANLSYISDIAYSLAKKVVDPELLIVKSTVPVGTTVQIRQIFESIFEKRNIKYSGNIAFIPEFLTEGNAISTFINADRVVIGADNDSSYAAGEKLFKSIYKNVPLVRMSTRSGELCKCASNAFLATKISFINEMARIASGTGANIEEVMEGMSYDKRIGQTAYPGCGFGGSCLPKDIKSLIKIAEQYGCPADLLCAVLSVNERQKLILLGKVKKFFSNNLEDKTIALWGLSFKPNSDDIREAISCTLINELLGASAKIQAYDPVASENIKNKYANQHKLFIQETKELALKGADALIVVTEWDEFKVMDYDKVKSLMKSPVVFDGRNIYNSKAMKEHGISYFEVNS